MRIWTIIFAAIVCMILAMPVLAQNPPRQGAHLRKAAGMTGKNFKVDSFVSRVDTNKDGSMTKEEWKAAGLIDTPFTMCDSNKDNKITTAEMAACGLPEGMDANGDSALTVDEMIEFDKKMAAGGGGPGGSGGAPGGAPGKGGPSGIPAGGFVANSPHVGDGPTGQDFINVLDTNKDGKVDHEEWEMNKGKTVYKNKRWPHYNKNGDQWITLDEAPQKGVNWEAAP
jgi:hypothetical protein